MKLGSATCTKLFYLKTVQFVLGVGLFVLVLILLFLKYTVSSPFL